MVQSGETPAEELSEDELLARALQESLDESKDEA
jgi:hypothetical protein